MFLNLTARRFSARRYASLPVDRTIIDRCCEAARLAPSACNSQPWHFHIIDQEPLRSAAAKQLVSSLLGLNSFALKAPVIVCIAADTGTLPARIGGFIQQKPFWLIDVGIAAEHFCLQAAEEGLGTCMIGWFDEKAVKKILGIPRPLRIPLAITAGYPEPPEFTREKIRKRLDEMRTYQK